VNLERIVNVIFEKYMLTKNRYYHLSGEILDASIAVHCAMGLGLLEGVYQQCLLFELRSRDLVIESTVIIPLIYKGNVLNKQYVADIIVENEIILELKAVEEILPVHEAQLISYLRLADKRLGFLINFNVSLLKNGFRRFVNNFSD